MLGFSISSSKNIYVLAYLNWLLWALTHLTCQKRWSTALRRSELKSHFSKVLGVLVELVQAFHLECGKGGSSYMGLSIAQASILCLCHLLEEMQQYQDLKVSRYFNTLKVVLQWMSTYVQNLNIGHILEIILAPEVLKRCIVYYITSMLN